MVLILRASARPTVSATHDPVDRAARPAAGSVGHRLPRQCAPLPNLCGAACIRLRKQSAAEVFDQLTGCAFEQGVPSGIRLAQSARRAARKNVNW